MNEILIIFGISILYLLIICYFFNFFKIFKNLFILIVSLFILKIGIFKIYNFDQDFLGYFLLLGLFISIKIHSYLFYMKSPTLHLSEIIHTKKLINKNEIKYFFLKYKFIQTYLNILIKQKILTKKKNFFYLEKKGYFFYKFYEIFFKIFIR